MEELLLYWHKVIEKDLLGFADPRTKVLIDVSNHMLKAEWVVRGGARAATFRLSPEGDFRWLPGGNDGAVPYRQFLLSKEMADFEQLSAALAGSFQPEQSYVSTKATTEGAPQEEVSDDLLLDVVKQTLNEPPGKTRMVFVKGDAGAGKTTLLKQLTGEQARNYLLGNARFLFMYVSAQGRALSNLRDALSGELDDLRAGFTRDAVPALVRHGLIVPIVDGFDELLGAAGYGDAFGSLQQFLTQIEGQGAMIVSARSAFYDVEFLGRRTADDASEAQYDVQPVTLSPWQDDELHRYLARSRNLVEISERDLQALESLRPADRDLLRKPFFASRFPQYVDHHDGHVEEQSQSLLEYLVDAYVERESGKIVDRDGQPLVPVQAHRQLFIDATEWMWSAENRDLSEEDLRFLAELSADGTGLSADTAQQFVTKITSYHGFHTDRDGGQRRFRFEHEIYFDYFLGQAVRAGLGEPTSMTNFLDRGIIPSEVVLASVDAENARTCLGLPPKLSRQSVLQENRRRNLGALIAAAFTVSDEVTGMELSDLMFANVSFGAVVLTRVGFRNCQFHNVALDRARFDGCTIENCHLDRIVVSDQTQLGITGLQPGANLRSMHNLSGGGDTYVPSEMVGLLRQLGTPGLVPTPPPLSPRAVSAIAMLQRVIQKYRRTNLICLQDDQLIRLFQDAAWPKVHELLVKHGIVSEESRQTSGAKKTFLRPQVAILDLLRHESTPTEELPHDPVGDFWREVRAL